MLSIIFAWLHDFFFLQICVIHEMSSPYFPTFPLSQQFPWFFKIISCLLLWVIYMHRNTHTYTLTCMRFLCFWNLGTRSERRHGICPSESGLTHLIWCIDQYLCAFSSKSHGLILYSRKHHMCIRTNHIFFTYSSVVGHPGGFRYEHCSKNTLTYCLGVL